ncbi:MAG: TIR domain-containing protein [Nevskiaceae bacterium]|jgi:hypothetical protein|nr:TIR domain-containing protein [Nevskiaceae bacterium]
MSQADPIRLFVTHLWEDAEDYLRVFEFLESARNFFYRNTSVIDDPPSGGSERIRDELRRQIDQAEVVIALPGLYERQPDLAIFQMNHARSKQKPVLLMKYFGTRQELPKVLVDRATEVADWNERGLVDALRLLARGENTARFETIEFNPDEFKDFKLK